MHNKHDINLLKRGPHYLLSIVKVVITAETVFPIQNEDVFIPCYGHFPLGSYPWHFFFPRL